MKKQSSIEWLIEQLGIEEIVSDCKKEYRDRYIEKIQQAREMHKQEIIEAYEMAIHDTINFDIDKGNEETVEYYKIEYYNETFKSE